jgi:hypothetical protein
MAMGLAVGCSGSSSATASAILMWDPVSDPNLGGYRVYFGTASGSYFKPGISVGKHEAYELRGLSRRTTYYFAVTAYDFLGNESAYSNEVSRTIK